ncbi:MAG: class D beta-lactamase [Candidatus Caenarcaniphilales bacterium]|nr:class D beta-lactamase [Candidatus Caenarcaniphilales bacterium]
MRSFTTWGLLIFLLTCFNFSCTQNKEKNIDLNKYFSKYRVQGTFLLYDQNKDQYFVYNKERAKTRLCPASSFKIFGTLAILDSEVIKNEKTVLKWDGTKHFIESFNQDLNLEQAYKYSAEWVYQKLIKEIGHSKMQNYLTESHYGNETIGEKVNAFWLDQSFKVSAYEQVEFLKKLDSNDLPFHQSSIDKTKTIMIHEHSDKYILRGKTGTTDKGVEQMSWFIGYLEQNSNKYFFATNVYSPSEKEFFKSKAVQARIPITKEILKTEFNLL